MAQRLWRIPSLLARKTSELRQVQGTQQMASVSGFSFCYANKGIFYGRTVAQAVSRRVLFAVPVFEPMSGHVGFLVDKAAL
jgi:hypothetical protein